MHDFLAKIRTALIGTSLLALSVASAQQAAFDPMELGQERTRQFYAGELEPIVAAFSQELDELFGGEEGLSDFRQQVLGQLGAEVEVLDEQVSTVPGAWIYQRSVRFEAVDDIFLLSWGFDESEAIIGLALEAASPPEAAPSHFLDYQTRATLRLPFEGEWWVVWGGRDVAQNYHAVYPDQRFAYDLLVVVDDATHVGDGTSNEDYHCFGLEILAPAAGVVVVAEDGVPDNAPGVMNPDQILGNYVVIDHGEDEYSFLSHLQEGSLTVVVGDEVAEGTVIGRCGNSGNSTEPHLHYHLQNTPEPLEGEGLPSQFVDYYADDEHVERGEPVQGQRVRH